MLTIGSFPAWWPFLVQSYAANAPAYELIVVHTGAAPSGRAGTAAHVRYVAVTRAALAARLGSKLGATEAQVEAKLASGKGLSDLKPYYGRVFDDLIPEARYTHWGWVDWDLTLGDLGALVPPRLLWEYDALTFPGATLGFAWAGQLSIFRNTAAARTLYEVVPDHLRLGLKSHGDGQSGWEERVLLRETLRRRPELSILFHMGAQFDYKAQWLTWVPFDHYWDEGRVWRCAKAPLSRPGRPPLLVTNATRFLADVAQVQRDPNGFYARKDGRVCIRWDLDSSPWKCCPQGSGVTYAVRGGVLEPRVVGYPEGDRALRERLARLAREAGARPREPRYDVCQQGAFFHAGLAPRPSRRAGGGAEPRCGRGSWALQDDIGRFSGSLQLLEEDCGA